MKSKALARNSYVVLAVIVLLCLFIVPHAEAQGQPPSVPPRLPPNAPPGARWVWRELSVPITKQVYNKSLTDLTSWIQANYPGWRFLDRYVQGAGAFRLIIGRWTLMGGPLPAVIVPPGTEYGGSLYCRRYPGDPVCRRRG